MTDLTARITEMLRALPSPIGAEPFTENDDGAPMWLSCLPWELLLCKVAKIAAAAAEEHYRHELGWTVEHEHPVRCTCGHPKVDHAHVPTDGRTGIQIANCIAGRGARHTNCDCGQWEPVGRTRLVTGWSPGAGE